MGTCFLSYSLSDKRIARLNFTKPAGSSTVGIFAVSAFQAAPQLINPRLGTGGWLEFDLIHLSRRRCGIESSDDLTSWQLEFEINDLRQSLKAVQKGDFLPDQFPMRRGLAVNSTNRLRWRANVALRVFAPAGTSSAKQWFSSNQGYGSLNGISRP